MAHFQDLSCSSFSTLGPLGEALNIPKSFWEPGSASFYKGHFGSGSIAAPFSAALVVGPSPTSPLSINTLGLEVLNGIRNVFGVDTKTGQDISLGALRSSYAALDSSGSALISKVIPQTIEVSPNVWSLSSKWDVGGFARYNGRIISTEPDSTSDIRLKKNITRFDEGLNIVLNLKPVRFDWREDKCPSSFLKEFREPDDEYGYPGKIKRQYGLIAQEVEEIAPDLIGEKPMYDKNYKMIRYEKIVPILISAVQEQQKQIEELKNEINLLKQNK
jgi:hypothetical protein